ncbi:hypothetical protein QFC21_000457 [Naganishia friedmannii]|uniref:Uncharacterized protein n=1 Tax=Naganishia friedmannii TaxID=89922 RepID=A0ACC2WD38_9TREE|nr:hypothetical protein QFC21_000457 [Naganishia friedmannii]
MDHQSTSGDLALDVVDQTHNDAMEDHDVPSAEAVYDNLELTDLHASPSDALHSTEANDHDVANFLRSAGVEVSEDHHDVDMGMNMEEDMTGIEDRHSPVEGMSHMDMHTFHQDGDHELLHNDVEAPTFDLHQINQELDASSSLPQDHHDTIIEHAQREYDEGSVFSNGIDSINHDTRDRSFADLNMAPSPDVHMPQAGAEEMPIPTGVQIVNEEVLINEEGLVPLSENVPSMPALRGQYEGEDDKSLLCQEAPTQDQFPTSAHSPTSGPVTAAMVKTPSASNPPLPIDLALTEPITAFYKLQFLEAPPAQTSGPHGEYRPKEAFSYYMQTLDVTIGRKVNRLKKAGGKQQERRTSGGAAVDSGEMDDKKVEVQESDMQESDMQEQPSKEKVNSAKSLYGNAVTPKIIEGECVSEQGKRSAPPEVPPAKEIAKPPIDEDNEDNAVPSMIESFQQGVKREEEMDVSQAVKQESGLDELAEGQDPGQTQIEDEDERQVDVDLGALKSVSRLHARIGYSYTLSQFYLDVLGRNGAWVDDVFKVKGSRVALGPYTKIQISTRSFYFILPPASIATYPIPLNQNAVSGPSASSFPFGNGSTAVASHQATPDNEKDLHHLFRQPATFNAFSTNREEWEDERMGLFGMGAGMGKNGSYGYKRHRKGRKCKKCRLHEFQHNADDDGDADHPFSASENEAASDDNSVCSCSRCASEKRWMSSSPESGVEYSSSLSSVSSSEESSSEEDGSDEEEDEDDNEDDDEEEPDEAEAVEEAEEKDNRVKVVPDDQEMIVETNGKVLAEHVVVVQETQDWDETKTGSAHIGTTTVTEDTAMESDEESEEETLASKLKMSPPKPATLSTPHLDDFNDEASPSIQVNDLLLEDSHVFPPTEADIQAVQDLIASTMTTPIGEEAPPLQIQGASNDVSFGNGIFSSMESSHIHGDGDRMEPVPEIKLTKAEKSALAARIREAKAAARKEEQERKKAEKLAQREKEKAEKAQAKADAAAAKAAKKQKADALERERMLAKMDSLQNTQTDEYATGSHDMSGPGMAGNAGHMSGPSFTPGMRPGMPRPMHMGSSQVDIRPALRPGMPGVRPPRPMANGFRPINSAANGPAGGIIRPPRPGAPGMPMRPGAQAIRPGPPGGPSMRRGPGSVPPIQAQMRPGLPMRPIPPGMRPVRPGQAIRPVIRPPQQQQRPPLQPHMNSGNYSQDGYRITSPDRTLTRGTSVLSQDGPSRSPSLDPTSQKRTTPLLGIDGEPFIGPEPIKPDLTYATIIYRALAGVDRGRGTLGQVCDWVASEWEWFRMNPESGWQNSIRHNLSLNKAFLKVPRVSEDDPESKGSVWILDPIHAPELVERERKAAEQKEARLRREAEKGVTLSKIVKPKRPVEKPYGRDSDADQFRSSASAGGGSAPPYSVESVLSGLIPPLLVPLNRQIPLMLGAIPPHLKSVDIKLKHLLPEPPYVYDNNSIILNPIVFGRFSKQQLAQMQALPTKSAIQVLRTYVLRWLQEKVKKLGPSSLPNSGSPTIRPAMPMAAGAPRSSGTPPVRPRTGAMPPRAPGVRPVLGQARPLQPGLRPGIPRPGSIVRPVTNGGPIRPGMRPTNVPGAPGMRPAPRPVNGIGRLPQPTPALDPETLRKITQLAESAIKTNSAQSANAKVLLQYLKQVGSQVNIAIATQILSTGVIPPNAIPGRLTLPPTNSTGPAVRPRPPPSSISATQQPSSVLGKRPADSTTATNAESTEAKRQKV